MQFYCDNKIAMDIFYNKSSIQL